MEKLYKLIVLFVGLIAMNLTVQAQFSYSPFLASGVKYAEIKYFSNPYEGNISSNYDWNTIFSSPKAKQAIDFTNYPNPASTFTTVGYTLTAKANVVLRVIDLTGKQLAVLIKQEQNAGKQEFYWELSKNNITSGMYILILQVNNKNYSRKIIVQ
ncbi:T9SS type A sorting domain-containing protein [Pedobacter polaris]|uniref:T9SS type A sorting domain-containing protein n=1 Tax=Pedobacter polaris TaxID=2571273 RepID=A0A4U1CMD7_9SPHI|nr:T9SS type A sorting domain-containing protein [Pedobacter polaris]TKC08249.1 T9SS type A sorting domain-containing protein [Pedobacter polaris]